MEPKQETMEGLIREASDAIWNGNNKLTHNQIDEIIKEFVTHAIEAHDKMLAEKVKDCSTSWMLRSENRDSNMDDAFEDGMEVMKKNVLALLK